MNTLMPGLQSFYHGLRGRRTFQKEMLRIIIIIKESLRVAGGGQHYETNRELYQKDYNVFIFYLQIMYVYRRF